MSDVAVHEKIGALTAKVDAAHKRVDKLEIDMKDDILDIKGDLSKIKNQLTELNNHMQRQKGIKGFIIFLSGLCGASITKLLSVFTSQPH